MTHRIEITLAGEAPDDELRRYQLLGNAGVVAAIDNLSEVLRDAGLPNEVRVKTTRHIMQRRVKGESGMFPLGEAAE